MVPTDGAKQGAAIGLGLGVLSNGRSRRNHAAKFETEQQVLKKYGKPWLYCAE
ncbi:hypothetical protein N9W21_05850 [Shewanella sp.]|nr:hypothetical protein [Shewanella sp.]